MLKISQGPARHTTCIFLMRAVWASAPSFHSSMQDQHPMRRCMRTFAHKRNQLHAPTSSCAHNTHCRCMRTFANQYAHLHGRARCSMHSMRTSVHKRATFTRTHVFGRARSTCNACARLAQMNTFAGTHAHGHAQCTCGDACAAGASE